MADTPELSGSTDPELLATLQGGVMSLQDMLCKMAHQNSMHTDFQQEEGQIQVLNKQLWRNNVLISFDLIHHL